MELELCLASGHTVVLVGLTDDETDEILGLVGQPGPVTIDQDVGKVLVLMQHVIAVRVS